MPQEYLFRVRLINVNDEKTKRKPGADKGEAVQSVVTDTLLTVYDSAAEFYIAGHWFAFTSTTTYGLFS